MTLIIKPIELKLRSRENISTKKNEAKTKIAEKILPELRRKNEKTILPSIKTKKMSTDIFKSGLKWVPNDKLLKKLKSLPEIHSDLEETDSEREEEKVEKNEITNNNLTDYRYITGFGIFITIDQAIKMFITLQSTYDKTKKVKLDAKMSKNNFLHLINKTNHMYFKTLLKNVNPSLQIYWTLENEFFLGSILANNNLSKKTYFNLETVIELNESYNSTSDIIKSLISKDIKPDLTTFSCWY